MNAICRLGIVPVRKEPSDTSEMVNQLIYGEQCYIIKNTSSWIEIEGLFDGYHGFVDQLQIELLKSPKTASFITQSPILKINDIYVPMGGEIHAGEIPEEMAEMLLAEGDIQAVGQKCNAQQLVEKAMSLMGSPYLWGGRTLMGIDCSGLTQVVFKAGGYQLPRDSSQQAIMGNSRGFNDAMSGDLAFFSKPGKDRITHVGIIVREEGNLVVIHASGRVRRDQFTSEGILNENGELTHALACVRQVLD